MMKFSKAASVEELQVIGRFESLRKILTSEQYADHRKKPLAYWALPTDRRLPLAFLGRTVEDLLSTPFTELSNTPGIGQKKMCSFVKLLARAANTDPSELPTEAPEPPAGEHAMGNGSGSASGNGFNPSTVSEVVWSQWRATVVNRGLGEEKLGRFAPSLQHMTRVIWNTPLEAYVHYSLADMRALKTHGEKRIRAILEVFHSLHVVMANVGAQDHLVVRIVPRLIDEVEQWVGRALQTAGVPSEEELYARFVRPLLEQVRVDAAQQIVTLAENRLGIAAPITSVRQASRVMGLTRARVYQLLNEINDIMTVRWPMGRHQTYELREKFQREVAAMDAPPNLDRFFAAVELFYPGSRRGAAGPLDHAEFEDEDQDEFDSSDAEHLVERD